MQVKKFEAPTIQEALETIKRELGPEAIILQTKQNKRGFGLLSKASVEVTAAVSERALTKKQVVDSRMPAANREKLQKLSAQRQAQVLDRYAGRYLGASAPAEAAPERMASQIQERVNLSAPAAKTAQRQAATQAAGLAPARPAMKSAAKAPAPTAEPAPILKVTSVRYADIDADEVTTRPATATTARVATQTAAQAHNQKGALENEIESLKRMILELQNDQGRREIAPSVAAELPQGLQAPRVREACEQLLLAGVDKKLAFTVVQKAMHELKSEGSRIDAVDTEQVMDRVALEIMASTETLPPFAGIGPRSERSQPAVIALVGPTGVGKTTTLAKMAADVIQKRGWKVGLINLDQYKVAAFDQLATYAKILNVPFRSAASAEDLKSALVELNGLDLILIDTTGRSQKDPAALQELKSLLSTVTDLRVHLVLSATTRDTELYDMAGRFSIFRPQGVTISKLDEATLYGAICNVSQKAKLPLLYFTTGQRVPEDIEEASQERVASLILDIS